MGVAGDPVIPTRENKTKHREGPAFCSEKTLKGEVSQDRTFSNNNRSTPAKQHKKIGGLTSIPNRKKQNGLPTLVQLCMVRHFCILPLVRVNLDFYPLSAVTTLP